MSRRKGRHAKGVGFAMYPDRLFIDRDFIALPAAARVIFFDMGRLHRHGPPSNNGSIGYGCAAGAKAANASPMTANRMLALLQHGGWIRLRRRGLFKRLAGEGLVSEWEITIFPIPTRMPAKHFHGDRKLHIEHRLLEAPAYKRLSNNAKCTLLEMMRRHDGGNNGMISFGGEEGAFIGFSARMTERALADLMNERFIVETAPAVRRVKRPRKWRLTMYRADGKPAGMDFLKPSLADAERIMGDARNPENVSMVTVINPPRVASKAGVTDQKARATNALRPESAEFISVTHDTFRPISSVTSDILLEASPPGAGRARPPVARQRTRRVAPTRSLAPRAPLQGPLNDPENFGELANSTDDR
jgi:hypothetical protein